MKNDGFFWFSGEMYETIIRLNAYNGVGDYPNFCCINGKLVQYTAWSHSCVDSGTKWDDIQYLGYGYYVNDVEKWKEEHSYKEER